MPLEENKKISLTHKENKESKNTYLDTLRQGVPQRVSESGGFTLESKGVVSESTGCVSASASLTVEAALVFPLFLFVMIGLLFLFRVLQVNQITYGALAVAGSQLSLEAGVREVSVGEAVLRFQKELLEAECPVEYILGGRLGIGWQGSSVEGDYIELRISYICKLPISVPGMGNIPIAQQVNLKKWTGTDANGALGAEADTWVYITPEGTVYHRKRECTHLRLSIQTMEKFLAMQNGYEPCLICGEKPNLYGVYYITEEGRKYHTMLECRGLKRTIYLVRLSEAGGRTACQRCGGE